MSRKEQRRASFNAILPAAIEAAKESGCNISVVHAPIYVDEFMEGTHVFCPSVAVEILCPHRPWMKDDEWMLDATIKPDGSILYSLEVCEIERADISLGEAVDFFKGAGMTVISFDEEGPHAL